MKTIFEMMSLHCIPYILYWIQAEWKFYIQTYCQIIWVHFTNMVAIIFFWSGRPHLANHPPLSMSAFIHFYLTPPPPPSPPPPLLFFTFHCLHQFHYQSTLYLFFTNVFKLLIRKCLLMLMLHLNMYYVLTIAWHNSFTSCIGCNKINKYDLHYYHYTFSQFP